jgi:flagellin-like protein
MKTKKNEHGRYLGFFKDNRGVSPVIAVILMVAITVVMAAIVSSWSAGVKAPTAPTTVGLDITRSGNNISTVVTSIDPASGEPLTQIDLTYLEFNGTAFNPVTVSDTAVNVGYSRTVDTNSTATKSFIVRVTFKDLSRKVLFSREV